MNIRILALNFNFNFKMQPPTTDPNLLPENLVAQGHDMNLWIVAVVDTMKKWVIFHRVQRKNTQLEPLPDFPEVVAMNTTPSYDELTVLKPKQRGRPKKNIKALRQSRPPTEYNLFMKREMERLTWVTDTKTKMKMIADLWKQHKSKI